MPKRMFGLSGTQARFALVWQALVERERNKFSRKRGLTSYGAVDLCLVFNDVPTGKHALSLVLMKVKTV